MKVFSRFASFNTDNVVLNADIRLSRTLTAGKYSLIYNSWLEYFLCSFTGAKTISILTTAAIVYLNSRQRCASNFCEESLSPTMLSAVLQFEEINFVFCLKTSGNNTNSP